MDIASTPRRLRYCYPRAGFTLIELLVIIGISLMITGGVIAGYSAFSDNQRLKQTALNFKNDLRLVQNRAMSGQKPEGVVCNTLEGYRMVLTETSYRPRAICDGAGIGPSPTTTLPPGVQFVTPPAQIRFDVLSGTVVLGAGTIQIQGVTRTYELTISQSGDITDEGFQ